MLQKTASADRAVSSAEDGPFGSFRSSPATDSFQLVRELMRRQRATIFVVSGLVLAIAVGFLVVATPEYTARALIIIDAKKAQSYQQQPAVPEPPVDTASIDSQVEILKSDNIASSTIKTLGLTNDPEFKASGGGILRSALDVVRRKLGLAPAGAPPDNDAAVVRNFQRRLTIKRIGQTFVIEIDFRSSNGGRAAQIANAVAESYIRDQLDAKYEAVHRATDWLQDRTRELRDQVALADTTAVEFKTKNNIVSTGGLDKRLVGQQQVAELNSQLVVARAATAEAQARLDRIEEVLRTDSVNATVSDSLKSEVVSKLRSQYFDLSFREADWASRYGQNHQAAVNLRNQMLEIRKAIFDEVRRLAETYKSDVKIAKQREDGIQNELKLAVSQSQTSDSAEVVLRQLESSAQSYRVLYDSFLKRSTESVQQQSFPISEARLISPATAPPWQSFPNIPLVFVVSVFFSAVTGLSAAWFRDRADRSFRLSDEVMQLLGLECVALVPILGKKAQRNRAPTKAVEKHKQTIERDRGTVMSGAIDEPMSSFAEALRSIKLSIDLRKAAKVVGFTSSLPNEGKSSVVSALAQLISQSGSLRCVLVDCDLRNPTLSKQLAPDATTGLIEVLAGTARLDDVLWKDADTKLDFLPVSQKSRPTHTNEILGSYAMRHLFESLKERYEYILVDLSPVSPVVDVRTTSSFVDNYIYIVEWGVTKIDVVQYALRNARQLHESILGVVLNKVDLSQLNLYAGDYSEYHDNKYLERYGLARG